MTCKLISGLVGTVRNNLPGTVSRNTGRPLPPANGSVNDPFNSHMSIHSTAPTRTKAEEFLPPSLSGRALPTTPSRGTATSAYVDSPGRSQDNSTPTGTRNDGQPMYSTVRGTVVPPPASVPVPSQSQPPHRHHNEQLEENDDDAMLEGVIIPALSNVSLIIFVHLCATTKRHLCSLQLVYRMTMPG